MTGKKETSGGRLVYVKCLGLVVTIMPSGRTTTLKTEHDFPDGEMWLEEQLAQNSPGNAKQKRIALEDFDKFLTRKDYELHDLNNKKLKRFSYHLQNQKGLADSTVHHRWYAVRAYLNEYVYEDDIGFIDGDKYLLNHLNSGTKTVQENDMDIHWLPQDKIEQLIEGAKNLKNSLVIQLLWNTGCRPSEVSRMKLRRMNRSNRSIKVQTSKVQDSDADNYERTVFYSRSMRKTMREWLDRGGRDSHPHAQESPYLVVGYNTPQVGPRQVNKIVRMAAEEAGIQEKSIETAQTDKNGDPVSVNRITPKTLRHSFAVHSVRGEELSGSPPMDLERLRRLMGHSSLEITRQYLRFRESELRKAYDNSHPA